MKRNNNNNKKAKHFSYGNDLSHVFSEELFGEKFFIVRLKYRKESD